MNHKYQSTLANTGKIKNQHLKVLVSKNKLN
ncbi:hypothetical protein SAMN06265220_10692 [Flavobacterium nitrogenifigens]|uniref:Uncharacterized protein n=1 Tax=Flavobacterium nitrogenifigens TaxID=1617283 RepID=A0A521F5H6_9FLAO|nr:hypothetical protein SAMN06265220_10692 [Flavobacterium nitrogenifigens]